VRYLSTRRTQHAAKKLLMSARLTLLELHPQILDGFEQPNRQQSDCHKYERDCNYASRLRLSNQNHQKRKTDNKESQLKAEFFPTCFHRFIILGCIAICVHYLLLPDIAAATPPPVRYFDSSRFANCQSCCLTARLAFSSPPLGSSKSDSSPNSDSIPRCTQSSAEIS